MGLAVEDTEGDELEVAVVVMVAEEVAEGLGLADDVAVAVDVALGVGRRTTRAWISRYFHSGGAVRTVSYGSP